MQYFPLVLLQIPHSLNHCETYKAYLLSFKFTFGVIPCFKFGCPFHSESMLGLEKRI